jgi:hypothetical protein
MTTTVIVLILVLLLTKHFIVDFPLQNEFQYKNKGIWMHPGGLLHSSLHGLFTLGILSFFVSPLVAIGLGLFDSVVHYLIDFIKVNINNKFSLTPINSEKFWWLLGIDQWLHQMTYLVIILILI